MIRLLRAKPAVARAVAACFSDGPSTSRVVEVFGETGAEPNTKEGNKRKPSSAAAERAAKRLEEKHREAEELVKETRTRIKRWKNRTHTLMEQDLSANFSASSSQNSIPKMSDAELQQAVDHEEREYEARADEIMHVLAKMTPPVPPNTSVSNPQMSARDAELKKKTGKVKFRKIIYNEGELDSSDIAKPPSPDNPHPFNPEESVPPVYSRSLVPFVNHVPLLQTLVDLGVNLFEVDTTGNCGKYLLRLDQDKDVKPKLQWLVSIGVEPSEIGDYLTRNPYFLIQDLNDMKARVNYLEAMKFKPEQVIKIIKEFRYWINTDVKTMDARLGWVQKQFHLKGDDVRALVVKEPRVIMFGLGPLQRLFDMMNKEFQFTMAEIKRILLDDPRVFMMDPRYVQNNYFFVFRVMRLPNSVIARNPLLLRCSNSNLKNRHEFLRKMGRARYEGQLPTDDTSDASRGLDEAPQESISLSDFLHSSDAVFASRAAKSYLVVYDKFLRSH